MISPKSLNIIDILDCLKQLRDNGYSTNELHQYLVEFVGTHSVNVNYDRQNNEIQRCVLCPSKQYVNMYTDSYILQNPYNSLVIDMETLNVASVGTSIVKNKISNAEKNHLVSDYRVISLYEGTQFNLYPYHRNIVINGEQQKINYWSMSTVKGIDVSNNIWLGKLSYVEIFMDCAKLYPDFLDHFKFDIITDSSGKKYLVSDVMETDKSYSFIVKHPNFHPFCREDVPQSNVRSKGLVFIRAMNLKDLTESEFDSFDLQRQSECDNVKELIEFTFNSKIATLTVGHLVAFLSRSLNEFVNDPHFGFRLEGIDGKRESIQLESRLLKRIRELVYNPIPREFLTELAPENRINYIIMRAYLNVISRNDAMLLFPEWKLKFKEYGNFIEKLVLKIGKVYRKEEDDTEFYKFARSIVFNYLIPIKGFNEYKSSKESDSIIRESLIDPQHTYTILKGYELFGQ